MTEPGAENCQFDPGQCITGFAGDGQSGFCAPVTGTVTLADTGRNAKDSVELSIDGTVCEDGPSAPGVRLVLDGTYQVTGGTKRFEGTGGTGTVAGRLGADGTVTFEAEGRIRY